MDTTTAEDSALSVALLREAIEGAAIAGWAAVNDWDGHSTARITEIGGTVHSIDLAVVRHGMASMRRADSTELRIADPTRIDSHLADHVVQYGLFGWIVYR